MNFNPKDKVGGSTGLKKKLLIKGLTISWVAQRGPGNGKLGKYGGVSGEEGREAHYKTKREGMHACAEALL